MNKNKIAKSVLFCEIGSNVGVYEDISKFQFDLLNNRKNSGTQLLDSIEDAWVFIALNGDTKLNVGWDSILTGSNSMNGMLLDISHVISSKFFGNASNEKLHMLIYEGVMNARSELIRGRVFR